MCRYTGQLQTPYVLRQTCVLVSLVNRPSSRLVCIEELSIQNHRPCLLLHVSQHQTFKAVYPLYQHQSLSHHEESYTRVRASTTPLNQRIGGKAPPGDRLISFLRVSSSLANLPRLSFPQVRGHNGVLDGAVGRRGAGDADRTTQRHSQGRHVLQMRQELR